MAVTHYTLTANFTDLLGDAYPTTGSSKAAVVVWIETNVGGTEGIVDSDSDLIALGPKRATADSNGLVTFANLIGSDSDSEDIGLAEGTLQYRVTAEYVNALTRKRGERWSSGWFSLTANTNLADVVAEQYISATYLSQVTAALDAKVDEAEGYADDAAASATAADASADAAAASAAEAAALIVTDLGTTDAQTAFLIENPSDTQDALTASTEDRIAGLPPGPVTGVTDSTDSTIPRVIEQYDDETWGYRVTTGPGIYRSTNDGVSWTKYCDSPSADVVLRLIPTFDGEVIVAQPSGLYRSTGWAGGTPSWSLKVTPNASARFFQFGVDGDGTKFIATEYSAGTYADSRYGHISTNGGATWSTPWDSVAEFGATDANVSHIHASCYDPFADRFYVSEGHGVMDIGGGLFSDQIAGLYCSDDDGATWARATGMELNSSPTVVVATDHGLVCGSDRFSGVWGVVRQDDPADEELTWLWSWRTGQQNGPESALGFGVRGWRDPNTGTVLIAFRASSTGATPIIAGGTPTAAQLLYEYPTSTLALDDLQGVVVTPSGRLLAHGNINGAYHRLFGTLGPRGPVQPVDKGGVFGGTAVDGASVAVGKRSEVEGSTSVAIGVDAVTTGSNFSTAIGHDSTAALNATAIGASTVASGNAVAIGHSTDATGSQATAIGKDAQATADQTTAIGNGASAAVVYGTAVGQAASSAQQGVAIGRSATTGANNSVAVGYLASTSTNANATAVGASAAVTGAQGTAVGKSSSAAANSTALGETAIASGSGSLALGRGVDVTQSNSVGLNTDTTSANQVQAGARHIELAEVTAPGAGAANSGRLFLVDNGAGKTQLVVRFATGAIQILATEP